MRSNEGLILQFLIGDEVGGCAGHPAGHGVEDAVDAIDHSVQDPSGLWSGRRQRPSERRGWRPSKWLLWLPPLRRASWRLRKRLSLDLWGLRLRNRLPLLALWRWSSHAHSPVVWDPSLYGDWRGTSVVLELVIVHVLAPRPRVLAHCGGWATVAVDHSEPLILSALGEARGQADQAERGQAVSCNMREIKMGQSTTPGAGGSGVWLITGL